MAGNDKTRRVRSSATEPIFTVTLDKGMASRNRLPLADVIRFLGDLKSLVVETGKQIERESGVLAPSGDYGLEVLADGSGRFLTKGSVRASIAITQNIDIGARAVTAVLATLQSLNTVKKSPRRETAIQAAVIFRLDKMAFMNTHNKVDAKFSLVRPPDVMRDVKRAPVKAMLNDLTIRRIREFNPHPVFLEEGVTLFGKLFHLKDKAVEPQEEAAGFWGELRLDNGKRWRVQFPRNLEAETSPLFTRQVAITGTAHYFEKRAPKLVAKSIGEDIQRDYESAFDEMLGTEPDLFENKTLEEILYK